MRKVRSVLVAATALLLLSILMPSSSFAATWTDGNGCTNNLQNPHVSAGALGVIVKADFSCTQNDVTSMSWDMILWLCKSSTPQHDETWLWNNCVNKGRNTRSAAPPVTGKVYTKYAPPLGQPGAKGSGYWIACSSMSSNSPGGFYAKTIYSATKHLTA
jgi:hypothetical protein